MRKFFFVLFLFVLFVSCVPEQSIRSFSVVTWNCYLFFDSRDDGNEYSGFKAKDGYNDAVYKKRIKDVAIMMSKNLGDADLIVLEEVESNVVLFDLLEAGLKKKGFLYYGIASDGSSPLSVGFISKYCPDDITLNKAGSTRLVLELSFELNGDMIAVIAIHATSRLNGGESERFEEFSLMRSIADENEGKVVLLCGDFNTDPRYSESGLAYIKDPISINAPLVVTGDPGECSSGIYFSQALDYMNDIGKGTYLYDGEWFFFDNIFLSKEAFDLIGWEYSTSNIIKPYESVDLNGNPLKFDPSTSRGMSDHLPLKCTLLYN